MNEPPQRRHIVSPLRGSRGARARARARARLLRGSVRTPDQSGNALRPEALAASLVFLLYFRPLEHFLLFVLVGFVAQLIDGILGMAYGVSATSFLLSLGVAPAVASASVHAAEVVTTGFSGLSHLRFGNVDRTIVRRLLIPGVVGAIAGAYLLVSIPGDALKPWIAAYLLVMGVVILSKAVTFRKNVGEDKHHHLVPLGFAGGFLDAVGGGGWGPIVTGTLVARGNNPRFTIGSVNMAEFFVTAAASATFIATIGLSYWEAIAGLALGGALAAPIAAWATSRVPARPLLVLVGLTVVALSARTIWLALR